MNALPPPTTPPVSTSPPEPPTGRRWGRIALATAAAVALAAGGVVVGVAVAGDSTDTAETQTALDLTATQVDNGDWGSWIEDFSPFVECLEQQADDAELGAEIDDLDDLADVDTEQLKDLVDTALAWATDTWESCSDHLPDELPGLEILDQLEDFDLDEFDPEVILDELPGLEEFDLDVIIDELPGLEEFDLDVIIDEFDLDELPDVDDLPDFDPEVILDDLEGELSELLDDEDLRKWLDELLGELPPELSEILDS